MSALSEDSFAGLMAAVGPFETRPALAVAVSGGADSLALCLLMDIWVRRRKGRLIALTVDHGLRAESSQEAAQVGLWLAARGVEHHVLSWDGDKPKARLQEAAREARYDVLTAWCREHGVLHLALGHQEEDQAETFLMRLARGSGEDGLAAISAIVETAGVRLIRPLLGVSRGSISETLRVFDQEWIEDPSNRNRAFERVRVRGWLPSLAEAGCSPGRIAAWAADFGRRRTRAEAETAKLLAATCRVHPAGYAELASGPWANAADDLAVRALGRVAMTIGGGRYAPGRNKVEALLRWLRGRQPAPSVTLGRCRFLRKREAIVVCREARRLPSPTEVAPGVRTLWDDRFRLEFDESLTAAAGEISFGALGRDGWRDAVSLMPALRKSRVPYPARLVLPAIRDVSGILDVPHLGYRRPGTESWGRGVRSVFFTPRNGLSFAGFCLADSVSSTMSSGVMEPADSALG